MLGLIATTRFRVIVAYTLTLMIFAAGAYVAWYRTTYNVWPAQEASTRVHWCARNYETSDDSAQTWQDISTKSAYPIRSVGRYPPLALSPQQLFAPAVPGAHPNSCGTVVYLRTKTDAYRAYSLIGGP
jgi:hypothetical protein